MYEPHNRALQKKLEWLQWAQDPKNQKIIEYFGETEIIPEYIYNLEHSDTYYLDKHFCQMVDGARLTVPEEMEFDMTQLQSPYGWLFPETPFEVPLINAVTKMSDAIDNYQPRVHAVGWNRLRENSYRVAFYLEMPPLRNGFACWSYTVLTHGDKLSSRIEKFEKSQNVEAKYTTFELHEIRWFYTAINLMAQKITVSERRPLNRIERKWYKRNNMPPPEAIKVVMLRRYQTEKSENKGNVNWQFQWAVRGHWRNQYFPSEGVHKPVFIESFIKGPVDKPFKNPGLLIFHAGR